MDELPVIGSPFIRKRFWDCQGANIASFYKKMYRGNLFQRPKNDFRERSTLFSTQIYPKSIWASGNIPPQRREVVVRGDGNSFLRAIALWRDEMSDEKH